MFRAQLESGTIQLETGTIQLEPGTIQLELGTIQLELGTIQLEPGNIQSRNVRLTQLRLFISVLQVVDNRLHFSTAYAVTGEQLLHFSL